jgi:hypothetical protein
MSQMHVEMSAVIDAKPEDVYAVMSDYKVGHAAILPKPYFVSMDVEEGGRGAGTVARVKMKVMGVEANYRMLVSEPEPGRILIETDPKAGVTTIFTFDSLDRGSRTRLTFATEMQASPGFKGFVEKL